MCAFLPTIFLNHCQNNFQELPFIFSSSNTQKKKVFSLVWKQHVSKKSQIINSQRSLFASLQQFKFSVKFSSFYHLSSLNYNKYKRKQCSTFFRFFSYDISIRYNFEKLLLEFTTSILLLKTTHDVTMLHVFKSSLYLKLYIYTQIQQTNKN